MQASQTLLGVKAVRDTLSPKTARLLKHLRRIEELPRADQRADCRAILKLVDSRLEARRRIRKAS